MASRSLRAELAPRIAPVVLANITTRYPYHDARLFREGDPPFDPFAAHPAFGNSFDWHSSVHSHWTALQLLAHWATDDDQPAVVCELYEAIGRNLTAQNVDAETAFVAAHPTYERPYGWAWALRLAAAAEDLGVDAAANARPALVRLARRISEIAIRWLDVMPGPVRHGVHSSSAYAMGLMLDASRTLGLRELAGVVERKAREWFGPDRDYPAAWERSAHDFLSPGLTVADLMRRVMGEDEFIAWWRGFVPLAEQLSALVAVADVPDVSDGQIVHLHGLNLSRAGVLARLAALGPELAPLLKHARRLYAASVDAAYGGEYLSTHWLPTFAWDAATSLESS